MVVMHLASGIWFLCGDGKGEAACLPGSLRAPMQPFKCCGAGECKTFEHSCQNPANYPETTPRTDAEPAWDALVEHACGLGREIERMRGAIANARSRIVQHWPDGPVRGSVIAWLDDAVYGREATIRAMRPERYLGGMAGESRRVNDDQRQGADSPTSATIDPSADQDHAPARNNAQSTVGALQEATETPRVQSAPATLPWCACKGPWCEGRDRDFPVRCLGYQIDSDGGAA